MSALHAAAAQLADLLERENAALQCLDLPAATALLAGKRAALDAFESAARKETPAGRFGGDAPAGAPPARRRRREQTSAGTSDGRATTCNVAAGASGPAGRAGQTYGAQGAYVARASEGAFAFSARA